MSTSRKTARSWEAGGSSLSGLSADLNSQLVEKSKGDSWAEILDLFAIYCERIVESRLPSSDPSSSDGSVVQGSGAGITGDSVFKRAISLSTWMYTPMYQDDDEEEEEDNDDDDGQESGDSEGLFEGGTFHDSLADQLIDHGFELTNPDEIISDEDGDSDLDCCEDCYRHPFDSELECVFSRLAGGKQIAQFALFVPRVSQSSSDDDTTTLIQTEGELVDDSTLFDSTAETTVSLSEDTIEQSNDESLKKQDAYLVFKGTDPDKVMDVIADICAIPIPIEGRSIGIHCGIYATMKRDFDVLRRMIDKYSNRISILYVCGHSLGGGLATCFAFESILQNHMNPPLQLITFGSPTVLSLDFNRLIKRYIREKKQQQQKQHSKQSTTMIKFTQESHTIRDGLSIMRKEMREKIMLFAQNSHHVVNRLDLVPRVPASVPWVKGLIPYCIQQIVSKSVSDRVGLGPLSTSAVKSTMNSLMTMVKGHTDMYGLLLRTYKPIGHYYVFTGQDRYIHCCNPEKMEKVFRFIPPVKVTFTYDPNAKVSPLELQAQRTLDEYLGGTRRSSGMISIDASSCHHSMSIENTASVGSHRSINASMPHSRILLRRSSGLTSLSELLPDSPSDGSGVDSTADRRGRRHSSSIFSVKRSASSSSSSSTSISSAFQTGSSSSSSKCNGSSTSSLKKETVNIMLRCLDQRIIGTMYESELLKPDLEKIQNHDRILESMSVADRRKAKENEQEKMKERFEKFCRMDCVNNPDSCSINNKSTKKKKRKSRSLSSLMKKYANQLRIKDFANDFVVIEKDERENSGYSKLKFDDQAWNALALCHSTAQYLRLFSVSDPCAKVINDGGESGGLGIAAGEGAGKGTTEVVSSLSVRKNDLEDGTKKGAAAAEGEVSDGKVLIEGTTNLSGLILEEKFSESEETKMMSLDERRNSMISGEGRRKSAMLRSVDASVVDSLLMDDDDKDDGDDGGGLSQRDCSHPKFDPFATFKRRTEEKMKRISDNLFGSHDPPIKKRATFQL